MVQNSGTGKLVGGIISAVFAFSNLLVGLILLILGIVFSANPDDVTITINGEVLQGEEAREAALKTASVLKPAGIFVFIIGALLAALAVVLIKGYSDIKKQNAIYAQQYGGYNMQGQGFGPYNQFGNQQNPYNQFAPNGNVQNSQASQNPYGQFGAAPQNRNNNVYNPYSNT